MKPKIRIKKEWTIMVYMAGDNNLSEDMITALKQMVDMAGNKNIHLIALYDSNYPSVPVKIYEFTKQPTVSPGSKPSLDDFLSEITPQRAPRSRRPDPKTESYWIKTFVPKVTKFFPAKKYALILSGHSDAFIGKVLLRDENPHVVLDLRKLRDILYKSRPKVNGIRRKFDLLGFDGCLMSMLEVSYELRDVANVVVASEGNIPTAGWDYREVLRRLRDTPKMDELSLATDFVTTYAEYNVDFTVSGRSIDISACNLANVREVKRVVDKFARILHRILSLVPDAIVVDEDEQTRRDRFVREHFIDCLVLAHYRSQGFMHNQAVDLVDFVFNLLIQSTKRLIELKDINKLPPTRRCPDRNAALFARINRETQNLLEVFWELLSALYGGNTPFVVAACAVGAQYQFAKGTSVFFPWTTTAIEMVYDRYAALDFNRNKDWLRLLEKRLDLTIQTSDEDKFMNSFKASMSANALDIEKLRVALSPEVFEVNVNNYSMLAHREHGGKEHGGKEHGGKGELEAFYRYFSQFRHFDPDFFGENCLG